MGYEPRETRFLRTKSRASAEDRLLSEHAGCLQQLHIKILDILRHDVRVVVREAVEDVLNRSATENRAVGDQDPMEQFAHTDQEHVSTVEPSID